MLRNKKYMGQWVMQSAANNRVLAVTQCGNYEDVTNFNARIKTTNYK